MMSVSEILACAIPEGPFKLAMIVLTDNHYPAVVHGKPDSMSDEHYDFLTKTNASLCAAFEALMGLADGSTAELNEREGVAKERQRIRAIIEGMKDNYEFLGDSKSGIGTLDEVLRRLEADR